MKRSEPPRHCDDYIDDPNAPECLRTFLKRARAPAHGMISEEPFPKLFATIDSKGIRPSMSDTVRVRVTMASRFGDVGISIDFDREVGYDLRCAVEQLSDFSDKP